MAADQINPPPRRRIRPVVETPPQVEPSPAPTEGGAYQGPSTFSGMTLRQRIDAIAVFDREAASKMRLDTVFQFMLAKTPIDVMAQRMGYSISYIEDLRTKVRARIAKEAKELDVSTYLVEMMEGLKEIEAIGFREASAAAPSEWHRRLKGAAEARTAIGAQIQLLSSAGAFENSPLKPIMQAPGEDDDTNGVNVLKELSRAFLEGGFNKPAPIKTIEGDTSGK